MQDKDKKTAHERAVTGFNNFTGTSPEKYLNFSAYVSKYRFCSYWHQIDEVLRGNSKAVLEIGVGNNVVSSYLKQHGLNYVSVDINKELKPSVLGTVASLPFEPKSFDTVLCCQVLEHLPFQLLAICLSEIRAVCRGKLILSLPDKTPALGVLVRVPNFVFWDLNIPFPFAIREPIKKGKEHLWEIGRLGYPWRRIAKEIMFAGYKLEKTYRVPEYPYHRFFIASVL